MNWPDLFLNSNNTISMRNVDHFLKTIDKTGVFNFFVPGGSLYLSDKIYSLMGLFKDHLRYEITVT